MSLQRCGEVAWRAAVTITVKPAEGQQGAPVRPPRGAVLGRDAWRRFLCPGQYCGSCFTHMFTGYHRAVVRWPVHRGHCSTHSALWVWRHRVPQTPHGAGTVINWCGRTGRRELTPSEPHSLNGVWTLPDTWCREGLMPAYHLGMVPAVGSGVLRSWLSPSTLPFY